MAGRSDKLAIELDRRLRSLERTRAKIEQLQSGKFLSRSEKFRIYELLFLNAHVAFEAFLEDLFVGLAVENAGVESARGDIVPRLTIRSHKVGREVLVGPNKAFVSWLPYDNTEALAKIFFRGGRPFSELGAGERTQLVKSSAIRNAIAHQSRHSITKFRNMVIGATPVLSHERRPGGYLAGVFRTSPRVTRYENHISELDAVARKLAR